MVLLETYVSKTFPPSLWWVPNFAKAMVPADLYAWDLLETADPLKWILHLRFKKKLNDEEYKLVRSVLDAWCEANKCVYKRSNWKKYDFKAKILLRGLGPERNKSPF